jgi:hypothetical protein
MKRFVVVYQGQVHPVRAMSADSIKNRILRAYDAQDGKEQVNVGWFIMTSADIANGNYSVMDLDAWFTQKEKGAITGPLPSFSPAAT